TPPLRPDLPRSGPAPLPAYPPLLRGPPPRRHHPADRGRCHRLRLPTPAGAAHHNHLRGHPPASRPPGRLEAAVRVATRSVWRRLRERAGRDARKAVLITQQEVPQGQLRTRHDRPPQPTSRDLHPPVLPAAGDQPPGESATPV